MHELESAKIKVRSEKNLLETLKREEKFYRIAFFSGLVGGVYLGIRTFIGPDIDFDSVTTFYQGVDAVAAITAAFGGVLGGLGYLVTYVGRKEHEKSFNEAKSNLGELVKGYQS